MPEPDYTLSISLETLRHLGIGLYSNIPAVLSEVVANAYDADATLVEIDIDTVNGKLTVTDDGWGMSKADINNKYLKVGYDKRKTQEKVTPKGRLPMGRKGIGKLALFSIAETVRVYSVKENTNGGIEKSGLMMSANAISDCIKNDINYHPTSLPATEIRISKGTRIELSDLRLDPDATAAFLRRRLARRFSVIGGEDGFEVKIDDKAISVEDRDYFKDIEYIWYFGASGKRQAADATKCTQRTEVDDVVDAELGYKISGWIGTVHEQKQLDEGNNSIVVLARGKLVHEDLLKDMKEAGVYAQYLIGEVRADFLDLDEKEDIATSGRQSIREGDARFTKIKNYVQQKILKDIQNKWTVFRKQEAEKKALINPKIKEWFDSLGPDNKKWARTLFEKIEAFPIPDATYKKELYKNGILAFETLAQKQNLSLLDDISTETDIASFKRILESIDELEEVHYYEIVKARLEVLKKFDSVTAPDVKERVIHDHIFNHLWLLDTTWERASTNERMEQTLKKEFDVVTAGLTDDEKLARLDIRYTTAAGKHIVIELKKYDRTITIDELSAQVRKYHDALRKCLRLVAPDEVDNIEIICLLGSPPTPTLEEKRNIQALKVDSARYITYDTLVAKTQTSYRDYLEANKKISRIMELVDSI